MKGITLRTAGALVLLATLGGCAITSSHHSGPNGRPVHWIDGTSASAAYSKAGKLCPYGYEILGAPMQVSVVDYVMTIECKAAAAQETVPVAVVAPTPAAASYSSSMSREQQLQDLQNTQGLSYEEYKRRYQMIMGQ